MPSPFAEVLDSLRASFEALTKVVEAHGFELRGADADVVRDTRVLPLIHLATGINADVVIGGPGIEELFRSRAESADLGGTTVPVAAAEDVVAMKILSGRPLGPNTAPSIAWTRCFHTFLTGSGTS